MSFRVGAYCRVSTDREDQANSLRSQRSYFQEYIERQEGWTLADIYADEGISGTSTRRREAFHRMIRDAELGRVDLILTKEVSRFARNTVDTLAYTRKLKSWGVGVIFINDNIDTRENDGELRLTIMASIAQEESRKTSERVKWGQKRRMEAGVVFGNNTTYGFTTTGGKLYVKEDEAQVIRRIYHKFVLEGKGTHVIARELCEEGIDPPRRTGDMWSCVTVRRILRNEKYVGDLLQKKYITTDYLTHKKEANEGREDQIYLRDHHEAVIDRATWECAQRELERRKEGKREHTRYSGRYWCSGKIRCGICGSRFVLRKTKRPNGEIYQIWGCHRRVRDGNRKENGQGEQIGCNMRMINDKTLTTCVRYVLQQLDLDHDSIIGELAADIQTICGDQPDRSMNKMLEKHSELERKKERVMDAYFSGTVTAQEMTRMKEKYDQQLAKLDIQLQQAARSQWVCRNQQETIDELTKASRESLEGSEQVYGEIMESITVFEDYIAIRVRFLPTEFRLWYSTSGRGEAYTTQIEKCEVSALCNSAV